jgi:hypothetical protein
VVSPDISGGARLREATRYDPRTTDPMHMADNAMRGLSHDPDQRRQMVKFIESL